MLPACGWAALLAAMTHAMMLISRAATRRRYPATRVPRKVPRSLAEQVLADRDQPATVLAGTPGEWVEAVPLCRAGRLPVSTLFAELEQIATAARRPSGSSLNQHCGAHGRLPQLTLVVVRLVQRASGGDACRPPAARCPMVGWRRSMRLPR
jgi:hypothetical protein